MKFRQETLEQISGVFADQKPVVEPSGWLLAFGVDQNGVPNDIEFEIPWGEPPLAPSGQSVICDAGTDDIAGASDREITLAFDDEFSERRHAIRMVRVSRAILRSLLR